MIVLVATYDLRSSAHNQGKCEEKLATSHGLFLKWNLTPYRHLPLLILLIGDIRRLLHVLWWRLWDVYLRRVQHLMVGMNHIPSILNCFVSHCNTPIEQIKLSRYSTNFHGKVETSSSDVKILNVPMSSQLQYGTKKLMTIFTFSLDLLLCFLFRHFNNTNLQSLSYILTFRCLQKNNERQFRNQKILTSRDELNPQTGKFCANFWCNSQI